LGRRFKSCLLAQSLPWMLRVTVRTRWDAPEVHTYNRNLSARSCANILIQCTDAHSLYMTNVTGTRGVAHTDAQIATPIQRLVPAAFQQLTCP
jgi:hypothetical protein